MLYTWKKLRKEKQNKICNPKKKKSKAIYLKLDHYLVQWNFHKSIFIFLHFNCPPHFSRPLFSGFVNIFTYNGKDRVAGNEVQWRHSVAQLLNCTFSFALRAAFGALTHRSSYSSFKQIFSLPLLSICFSSFLTTNTYMLHNFGKRGKKAKGTEQSPGSEVPSHWAKVQSESELDTLQ